MGGVERAAASIPQGINKGIRLSVETIFPKWSSSSRWILWCPWYFMSAIVRLWQLQPDALIVSLWRAYAVGILLKLLRPKMKLVLFLHFPQDVHIVDKCLARTGALLANKVWADSKVTLKRRLPDLKLEKGHVISFVTNRITPMPPISVRPTFIFWGRLHAQKDLSRAIKIFASVHSKWSAARFWIIGPDGGELGRLQRELSALGLGESVQFLGPKNFSEIKQLASYASFYLQTSLMEGMAMSVVEAMQLGLVPLVTPVGEIEQYARHGENAVVIENDANAVSEVLKLLENDTSYQVMRAGAIVTWANQSLYKESVLTGCQELLNPLKLNELK
jgi:glycosyltransferase involved in cell wall biosynthesis